MQRIANFVNFVKKFEKTRIPPKNRGGKREFRQKKKKLRSKCEFCQKKSNISSKDHERRKKEKTDFRQRVMGKKMKCLDEGSREKTAQFYKEP